MNIVDVHLCADIDVLQQLWNAISPILLVHLSALLVNLVDEVDNCVGDVIEYFVEELGEEGSIEYVFRLLHVLLDEVK